MVTEAGFITIPHYIKNLVVKKMELYDYQPDGFVVKGTKNECGLEQNLIKIKRFTENHNGFYELVSIDENEAIVCVTGSVGLQFEKILKEKEVELNGKQFELFSQIN